MSAGAPQPRTPLHYAAAAGAHEVVTVLLEQGAVMSKAGGLTAVDVVQAQMESQGVCVCVCRWMDMSRALLLKEGWMGGVAWVVFVRGLTACGWCWSRGGALGEAGAPAACA
jgi:hypothetical protein